MNDEFELVRGSDNPFRDLGIPDADTELMKADLAIGIIRVLREREMSATDTARLAQVAVADISRIRKVALDRFAIDSLVDSQPARPRYADQGRFLAIRRRRTGRRGASVSRRRR